MNTWLEQHEKSGNDVTAITDDLRREINGALLRNRVQKSWSMSDPDRLFGEHGGEHTGVLMIREDVGSIQRVRAAITALFATGNLDASHRKELLSVVQSVSKKHVSASPSSDPSPQPNPHLVPAHLPVQNAEPDSSHGNSHIATVPWYKRVMSNVQKIWHVSETVFDKLNKTFAYPPLRWFMWGNDHFLFRIKKKHDKDDGHH